MLVNASTRGRTRTRDGPARRAQVTVVHLARGLLLYRSRSGLRAPAAPLSSNGHHVVASGAPSCARAGRCAASRLASAGAPDDCRGPGDCRLRHGVAPRIVAGEFGAPPRHARRLHSRPQAGRGAGLYRPLYHGGGSLDPGWRLEDIEANQRAYNEERAIVASSAVEQLGRAGRKLRAG